MLANPYLRGGNGKRAAVDGRMLRFSDYAGLRFTNQTARTQRMQLVTSLERNADTVKSLFDSFVRCTGHTHPIADFRSNLNYFTSVLAGPRFLLCHGSGSCLLLGSMFQSVVSRYLAETIDLYYSHSAAREFTHVFGIWRERHLVDPDQKTWANVDEIDQVPSLGYIFQQLGVAGHLVYLELSDREKHDLFAEMTRDYFEFYQHSAYQYMYSSKQDVADLARLFHEARTKFCEPYSVDAADFAWKVELRRQADAMGIGRPILLANSSEPLVIELPPQGALRIGIGEDDLPQEVSILSAIFLGRAPASIFVPLADGISHKIRIPEFPWLLVFEEAIERLSVNGCDVSTRRSRCGRFEIAGMGQFQEAFDLAGGHADYGITVNAPGATGMKIVLPINAFALSAGLVRLRDADSLELTVDGEIAA